AHTATTHLYTLSLHDALPISTVVYNQMRHIQDFKLGYNREQIVLLPATGDSVAFESLRQQLVQQTAIADVARSSRIPTRRLLDRSEEHTSELQSRENLVCRLL